MRRIFGLMFLRIVVVWQKTKTNEKRKAVASSYWRLSTKIVTRYYFVVRCDCSSAFYHPVLRVG
jgi:hypothetical protein